MNRTVRREAVSRLAQGIVLAAVVAALVPLGLVLAYTVVRGFPALTHAEFFFNVERPVGIPGSGVAHAIVGTLIMVGLASLLALPVGIVGATYLVEYRHRRWADFVRLAADVLTGAPSIAIGIFAYAVMVAPSHRFSALGGAFALAVLMLPVVIRTTEGAVGLIPAGLREAGVALGLPRWRVAFQLVLPAAAPGVVTGALLSVARASGETAPLLFTAFGNRFMNFDPSKPMSSLTLIVFHDALAPYDEIQAQAWGAALLLVLMVLVLNVAARLAIRRQSALAGRL